MLRGMTHGSAALYSTSEHAWLQVEGGEKEKATKGGTAPPQRFTAHMHIVSLCGI